MLPKLSDQILYRIVAVLLIGMLLEELLLLLHGYRWLLMLRVERALPSLRLVVLLLSLLLLLLCFQRLLQRLLVPLQAHVLLQASVNVLLNLN